ncbi:MAG: ABC transporter substrate-binding protein [Deltaproteobacteria bacterium]|nr:ABC transporter substrate-binding protein [Deltaproteobacteria bacterium]
MKRFNRIIGIGLSLVMISVLAVGLSPVSSQAADTKTLKIGLITALSGAGAVWGRGILHGAEMATEELNARGGLNIGGDKYKVELVVYDDKYTGAGGAAAVHKAVFSDKVKMIIGSISSASVLTMQETTEPNKILLFSNSWARKVVSPKKPYTFRMFMTSTQAAPYVARTVKDMYPNAKKVVTLAANDASGWSIGGDYAKAYEDLGMEVIKEFPERKTKDYYPILTRIKAKKPDVIQECALGVGAAALLTKQAKELGIKAPVVGGAWIDPKTFVKSAGGVANAEGYIYPIVFDRSSKAPAVVEFIKKFRAKYGDKESITTVDPSFYDATRMVFAGLEKAGTVDDTAKIKAAMEGIQEFEGIFGKMKWTGMETYGINHQILQPLIIAQIQNGKEVIIVEKPKR